MKRILGFLFWLYWFPTYNLISYIMAAVPVILAFFLSAKKFGWLFRKVVRLWAKIGYILAFSKVEVRGKEHLINDPSMIIANHQSTMDIMALGGYFPLDFLFFSKKEVFYIPFIGWIMKKAEYISVDRKNAKKAARSLKIAIAQVKQNNRVLVFPEGTRSADPSNMLPFKPGLLLIARWGKVPIIPVVIYGTSKMFPAKKSFFAWPHKIILQIMEPILPTDALHPAQAADARKEDEILERLRVKMVDTYRQLAKEFSEES